jgi:hypothetical protein
MIALLLMNFLLQVITCRNGKFIKIQSLIFEGIGKEAKSKQRVE